MQDISASKSLLHGFGSETIMKGFDEAVRKLRNCYSLYTEASRTQSILSVRTLLSFHEVTAYTEQHKVTLPLEWASMFLDFLPRSITTNRRNFNTLLLRASVVHSLVASFGIDLVNDLFTVDRSCCFDILFECR